MITKNIYGGKDLENLANKIMYTYISKGTPFALSSNPETYVKNGYAGNVNIYPIIRKIVNAAVGVKWCVKDLATEEDAKDLTLMQLLTIPNNYKSQQEFLDELMCWRLVTGNRYIYWMAPESGLNKGKPAELHILPASSVEIIQGTWLDPVSAYRLLIGDVYKEIPAIRVIHGKTTNLKYDIAGSQLYGMSPMEAALQEMTASNYGYAGLAKQYENGGPDIIVTGTKDTAGGAEYTTEQRQTVWAAFKDRFMGSKNKGKWLIKNLPVEVHEIGKSPVDLNTLAFLKLTLRDFCNIYNVPAELMNDSEHSTYNNKKEAKKALWNDAVIPELEYLKEDLNKIAAIYNRITNQNLGFDYDLSDIPELQEDKSIQASGLAQAHWMTQNERRQAMGLEPMDGMDELLIPMGLTPMSELMTPVDVTETANKYLDRHGIKY